ncbi:MAG: MBL fold metallo-hydrolase [Deltaproteobacteria bacterium]|nr:MBL fold metallo-hydrolase [Deltaproteobacteria bacterium]
MNQEDKKAYQKGIHTHCKITRTRLEGTQIDLTDFIFQPGGNVYVFSYEKAGTIKHTFVDAGDAIYRNQILNLFTENHIDPTHIERIFITHRHRDHCGLADLLAEKSGATIMAHSAFRDFVEGRLPKHERWWLSGFDPTVFQKYDIQYVEHNHQDGFTNIGGTDFPRLGEPIEIGAQGRLELLGCPDSRVKHSPDQMIILYSPSKQLEPEKNKDDPIRPTNDIIFAGDLWLMQGPIFDTPFFQRLPRVIRFRRMQIRGWLTGSKIPRLNVREQDVEAKEALKYGFHLIRVKPGHGEEFLGARIIPLSLLADQDLLEHLGYSIHADQVLLANDEMIPKIEALREEAYSHFIDELTVWKDWGYTPDEISDLLIRIFHEQKGGKGSVKRDRMQRKVRLYETLLRFKKDHAVPEELRQMADILTKSHLSVPPSGN